MTSEQKIFDATAIDAMIDNIAKTLATDIKSDDLREVALIGIQLRGVPLVRRIADKLNDALKSEIQIGTLDISMYRDDIGKRKTLTDIHETDIAFDLDDKTIILVDDILHTGRTIRAALDAITDYGRPKLIKLAVLIDRGGREFPISADYAGETVKMAENNGFISLHLVEVDGEDKVLTLPANPHERDD